PTAAFAWLVMIGATSLVAIHERRFGYAPAYRGDIITHNVTWLILSLLARPTARTTRLTLAAIIDSELPHRTCLLLRLTTSFGCSCPQRISCCRTPRPLNLRVLSGQRQTTRLWSTTPFRYSRFCA